MAVTGFRAAMGLVCPGEVTKILAGFEVGALFGEATNRGEAEATADVSTPPSLRSGSAQHDRLRWGVKCDGPEVWWA